MERPLIAQQEEIYDDLMLKDEGEDGKENPEMVEDDLEEIKESDGDGNALLWLVHSWNEELWLAAEWAGPDTDCAQEIWDPAEAESEPGVQLRWQKI